MSYLGDGRERFETTRAIHDALAMEFSGKAVITSANADEFSGRDADQTLLFALLKDGYCKNDLRLKL
jgi:hypothetical protein